MSSRQFWVLIVMIAFVYAAGVAIGALAFVGGGNSTPRECVQVSHSINERLGTGDDAGWVYDSRTTYTGDCGLAMLRGGD